MTHKNIRLAAYMLTGVVTFTSFSIPAEATSVSSMLPAAGLALTMEEGSAQEEVKASTKSMAESKEQAKKEILSKSFKYSSDMFKHLILSIVILSNSLFLMM